MDAQSIRAAAMVAPKKTEDVPTPFWAGTDGTIVIADQDLSVLTDMRDLAKTDPAAYSSTLIIKVLASKETGLPIFEDADRDWIKGQGSVALTITKAINVFFGFDTKAAVEAAKND